MQEGVKFELIHLALAKEGNLLTVSRMCEIAGVSRSGYYEWVKAEPKRKSREEQDRRDFERIVEAYKFRGYANF